jgi:predicted DsbA family dithiol-disulfide isomerase
MLKGAGKKIPGAWIVDTKKDPLNVRLRVQNVPVFVLISPDGNVLFNGHPTDDEFWSALEKINPEIMRPEISEEN